MADTDNLTDTEISAYAKRAYERGDLGGWNLARSGLSTSALAHCAELFAAIRARIVTRINEEEKNAI